MAGKTRSVRTMRSAELVEWKLVSDSSHAIALSTVKARSHELHEEVDAIMHVVCRADPIEWPGKDHSGTKDHGVREKP